MNGEDRRYCVYYLRCPKTNDIRYVGLTNNSKRRRREHMSISRQEKNPHLKFWKLKLRNENLSPVFEVFRDKLTPIEAKELEVLTIKELLSSDVRLINLTNGGEVINGSNRPRGKLSDRFSGDKLNELLKSRSHIGDKNPNFDGANCTPEWSERQRQSQSKKPLLVHLRDGTFIGEFRNSKECAKFLNCPHSSIRMFKNRNWAIKRKYLITDKN